LWPNASCGEWASFRTFPDLSGDTSWDPAEVKQKAEEALLALAVDEVFGEGDSPAREDERGEAGMHSVTLSISRERFEAVYRQLLELAEWAIANGKHITVY
jgi:hypothetical protein